MLYLATCFSVLPTTNLVIWDGFCKVIIENFWIMFGISLATRLVLEPLALSCNIASVYSYVWLTQVLDYNSVTRAAVCARVMRLCPSICRTCVTYICVSSKNTLVYVSHVRNIDGQKRITFAAYCLRVIIIVLRKYLVQCHWESWYERPGDGFHDICSMAF